MDIDEAKQEGQKDLQYKEGKKEQEAPLLGSKRKKKKGKAKAQEKAQAVKRKAKATKKKAFETEGDKEQSVDEECQ